LEATRRPELQALLTERVRADLDFNIANYRESEMPGDEDAVVLMYLALNWLILERLTLPGIFDEKRAAELVTTIVDRAIP
ncbi:TetR/AcrR family transcriptional regulator, partial [Nocardia gipuzkoensis]